MNIYFFLYTFVYFILTNMYFKIVCNSLQFHYIHMYIHIYNCLFFCQWKLIVYNFMSLSAQAHTRLQVNIFCCLPFYSHLHTIKCIGACVCACSGIRFFSLCAEHRIICRMKANMHTVLHENESRNERKWNVEKYAKMWDDVSLSSRKSGNIILHCIFFFYI